MVSLLGQKSGGNVQHPTVVFPGFKAEVAALVVEWVPRHVNGAVRLRLFKQGPPETRTVTQHSYEVRLRRLVTERLLLRAAHNSFDISRLIVGIDEPRLRTVFTGGVHGS